MSEAGNFIRFYIRAARSSAKDGNVDNAQIFLDESICLALKSNNPELATSIESRIGPKIVKSAFKAGIQFCIDRLDKILSASQITDVPESPGMRFWASRLLIEDMQQYLCALRQTEKAPRYESIKEKLQDALSRRGFELYCREQGLIFTAP